MRNAKIQARFLRAICAFVLLGILVAGLWPFHAPRNEVSWLKNHSGVFLGRHGSMVSAAPITAESSRKENTACALEIWLQPSRQRASGTILAFYRADDGRIPFALRQSLGDLALLRLSQGQEGQFHETRTYVEDVFAQERPVLVTISADEDGTTVYADGVFVSKSTRFKLGSQDLSGRLIVGNSPVTTDDWSGQLDGLAVYDRELTAAEVAQHFVNWTSRNRKDLLSGEGMVALYLFAEGAGSQVRNEVDPQTSLLIPESFFVLREQFLERPWDEFRQDWNYWKNVGINVVGFIPLGFFFAPYFRYMRKIKRATLWAIALGFLVSLTIELLQAFLPTRDSGMTDLITNTLGTALGVMWSGWFFKRDWFDQTQPVSAVPELRSSGAAR